MSFPAWMLFLGVLLLGMVLVGTLFPMPGLTTRTLTDWHDGKDGKDGKDGGG